MRAKDNNHLIPSPDDAVTRDSSSVYCIKRSVSYRRGKKKPKWVLYWVAHHPQGFRAVNEPRGRTSWTSFFFTFGVMLGPVVVEHNLYDR